MRLWEMTGGCCTFTLSISTPIVSRIAWLFPIIEFLDSCVSSLRLCSELRSELARSISFADSASCTSSNCYVVICCYFDPGSRGVMALGYSSFYYKLTADEWFENSSTSSSSPQTSYFMARDEGDRTLTANRSALLPL